MNAARDEEERARIVDILAPVAVDAAYSYLAPAAMRLQPGDSVIAPLGKREAYGVVWSVEAAPGARGNLKTISARLDRPPLSQTLRGFIDWLARYTLTPRGMALRLATRAAEDAGPEAPRTLYRASGAAPERLTPTRARVLAAAEGGVAFSKKALAEAAACSTGVIDALVDEGALEAVAAPPEPIAPKLDPLFAAPVLEPAQREAAEALKAALAAPAFKPFLLEGVTGSGKTEVYFEAIAAALQAGGQALVMMPEIALTAQFLERFAARFGEKPAEWHSGISARKRARIWRGCATGDVCVVVGARSALFLPFSNLRLIVVDEEHEGAYKQDDGVS
ncbi:MAG: DEAD/DEAH box helicase, partial [Alphaproteobacteria bacterium]|nr:DEAD/DEAH box helicase [Alphaproteobacteria bacterium]